jgi:hypothetical protein
VGFQCLDYPPYSSELVSSDYLLFPGLKKQLKGSYFSSETEVVVDAEASLEEKFLIFFQWLSNLEQRAEKFIELRWRWAKDSTALISWSFI